MPSDLRGVWRPIKRQDHLSNANPRRRRIHLACGHKHIVRMDMPLNTSSEDRFDGSAVNFFCTECNPELETA